MASSHDFHCGVIMAALYDVGPGMVGHTVTLGGGPARSVNLVEPPGYTSSAATVVLP